MRLSTIFSSTNDNYSPNEEKKKMLQKLEYKEKKDSKKSFIWKLVHEFKP